jgi:cytohesin
MSGIRRSNCGDVNADSLFFAAGSGDLAEVKRLVIGCGVDPNIQDENGETPLHYAAWEGRLKVVKLLLEHGADPNVQDKDGETPLHLAAWDGHLDVVELLLEHGANPNIQENKYGKTPLHYAVSRCLENKFGRTLLHFTVSRRHVDVARVLLDHGADPTISDNEGMTPLDYGSNCEELREMLRRGDSRTTVYK